MCYIQGSTINTTNIRLPLWKYLTPPLFNDDKKHGVKELISAFERLNNTPQNLTPPFTSSKKLSTSTSQLTQNLKSFNMLVSTQRYQPCALPVQKNDHQNSAKKPFSYPLLVSGSDSELRSPALVLDMMKKISSTINEDNQDDEYFYDEYLDNECYDDEYYINDTFSQITMQKLLDIEKETVDVNAELRLIEQSLNKFNTNIPGNSSFKNNSHSSHPENIQSCANSASKDKVNPFNWLQSGNYKFIY